MGITGLIPFLKDASIEINISDLKNSVAVIDTYCWLHKALIPVAYDIYRGKNVTTHVEFCIKRVDELKKHNIKPIFVFDGRDLIAKNETEKIRKANRKKARDEIDFLFAKKKDYEAKKILPRCIDITQELAHQVILKLIEENIDYIVAPYEADAQIAYLLRNNFAHFAISEDSDLILYGCKYVLYKFNTEGNGVLIQGDKINRCLGPKSSDFDFKKFRRMCILSGCDYLTNLPGIGLQKAKKFFSLTQNEDLQKCLYKLPSYLNMKKLVVPPDYVNKFMEAEKTFEYQLVFCPKEKKLKSLEPYKDKLSSENLKYAGDYYDEALQFSIGNCNFDNMTLIDEKLKNLFEKTYFNNEDSIWCSKYTLKNPDKLNKVIEEHDNPCFECPEFLVKRKFNETESNEFSAKKLKKSENKIVDLVTNKDLFGGDKNNFTKISSKASISKSPKKNKFSQPISQIVKSRFFAEKNTEKEKFVDLDVLLDKKTKNRKSLEKDGSIIVNSQSSVDSGCYSSNSQL